MECPKCGAEIDKSAMVCPNCKKVLKIVCPVCRTVNTKNTCKKCGEILVTKCAKCGKINLLKNKKCVKCGYSNEVSAIVGESNTDKFALLRIDFPNSDVVKATLGSNKLYQKFRTNLDALILSYVHSLNVRRQIINNDVYIIRFNRDYTFSASANTAIQATIELINIITKMNVRLLKKKNVGLKCNFTIMQRDAEGNPNDFDAGFNANMVYQSTSKELKALDLFQVITDDIFYEYYRDNYKMESLNSAMVNGEMKRFYEMDVKEFVNINDFLKNELVKEKDANDDSEMPSFIQSALINQEMAIQNSLRSENDLSDEEIYDIEMINFEEINCAFYKTESINVLDCVVKTLQEVPKGVTAIKASSMYQPYTLKLLSAVDEIGIYDNVIPITCYDDMKYLPYSFFRELVSSIFDYTISQKMFDSNDFSMFSNVDSEGLIKDLIKLSQRGMQNLEDVRNEYGNTFISLLQAIPNTLIYIENFEKIDESSLFILEQFFDHLDELNISYLLSYDKDFSLHKHSHFMLSRPYYTEILLTPTPFEFIVAADQNFYKDIVTDFYFQRVAKYACGSTLFLDFAIQYLVESGVYEYTEDSIQMVNPKTIIIPSGLEKLVTRRLNLLKDDSELLKFLTTIVLLGTRIDEKTLNSLGYDWQAFAEKLAGMGYLYNYNNCIYFPNYNVLRKCLKKVVEKDMLLEISDNLFQVVYSDSMPLPVKAALYDLKNDTTHIIEVWEKLANINLSMGDFPAYINCSTEILNFLDKYADSWTEEDLVKYKLSLYENVSNNMYEYNPEKSKFLAEATLSSLLENHTPDKYISLCTKMIQGSMEHGDYLYALNLTHGVLSVLDKTSIDPASPDFSLYFLLMSIIYVKILFNIGAFDDCLDIGYNVLNVLDDSKIDSINYDVITKEEFKYLVSDCVGYIALVDVLSMKEDVGEFLSISKKLLTFTPDSYSIFVALQKLMKEGSATVNPSMVGNDIFSPLLYHLINAFVSHKDNPTEFAQEVYKTKLYAKDMSMHNFEYFADLMIGYAYVQLRSFKKANAIIYKIIKDTKEKGLSAIEHIAWYVLSIMNIKEGNFDIAYGVLNNSNIQMEKTGIFSEYLILLNKVNMYKVLMCTNSQDKAQICMNQASTIAQKYGLNFNLNIDIKSILLENSDINREKEEKAKARIQAQQEAQIQATAPVENKDIVSEKVEESNPKSKFDDGDEIVTPEDFFSM